MNGLTEIKRRSARAFTEEEDFINKGKKFELDLDPRNKSTNQIEMQQSESRGPSQELKTRQSMVNLGRDTNIFPTKEEDIESHIAETLQAAKTSIEVKQEFRPTNLGVVIPGKIFRSSWPTEDDFISLESLGLKTVLSLVKNDFAPDFMNFVKKNNIVHKLIDMPGTKKVPITEGLMQEIMETVLDESNYPILIHCNHGKHRTGCVVAVVRHVARWDIESILEEYRGYAAPKARQCDIEYITEYKVSSLHGLFVEETLGIIPQQHEGSIAPALPLHHAQDERSPFPPWRARMKSCLVVSAVALGIWIYSGLFWQQRLWGWTPRH
ncbi:hypothetical protein PZA11_003819 [Diplocarpon coronariae]|uniref:Tyrosine specific protein phosphatases domain-containing protein n=1 Tax=Diplocarpon coronariae TaxID=2795749 RepID=A0A218Z7W7_9HELO|nr:hypothetical protein B2J93_3254 [Marssonina coronariae]